MKHTKCTYKGCPDYGRYCRRIHPFGSVDEKEETVESIPLLLKEAQAKFNLFIRLRDKGKPCISCGATKAEDAGHYLPLGSYSGVRFHEHCVNLQCHAKCNVGKYGNPEAYREGLIKKIGKKKVEALEALAEKTKMKKWTRSELLEIIETYTQKIKAFKNSNQTRSQLLNQSL